MTTTSQQSIDEQSTPQSRAYRPAGFFSRLEAFMVDLMIIGTLLLVASTFAQAILRFFRIAGLVEQIQTILANPNYEIAIGATLSSLFVIGYSTFFWSLVGFTPGKALLGLKVVRKDGARVSFGRALLRFSAYWISMFPLFLGFFWVLWDSNRQGWHDKIADTQVLYNPKK